MRIDEAGNVERLPGPAVLESDHPSISGIGVTGRGLLVRRSGTVGGESQYRYELWEDGRVVVLHEERSLTPVVDPGGATFWRSLPPYHTLHDYRRVADNGDTTWTSSDDLFVTEAVAPTAAALVLMTHGASGSEGSTGVLQLFDPRTAEMAWQLDSLESPYGPDGPPVYLHSGSRGLVLGYDGVAYVRASQDWNYYLIAYQTDQLPYLDHCLIEGCDPSNTGSIGLMR
jgi:hypothetical protein